MMRILLIVALVAACGGTVPSAVQPEATAAPTQPRSTPAATARATPTPTLKVTPAPTVKPTAAPTAKPTPAPTPKPTVKPTPKPTPKPTAAAGYYTPPGWNGSSDLDCGDFDTHAHAQSFFIGQGGPDSDSHRLDSDGDGIACESLP